MKTLPVARFLLRQSPRVPTRIHTHPDLLDELAALAFDLVDALRQGPILGATLLLLALLVIAFFLPR